MREACPLCNGMCLCNPAPGHLERAELMLDDAFPPTGSGAQ